MEKLFKAVFAYNLLNSGDKFEFFKGFGKDLQAQFPNGSWRTINGAKVFIHDGKVVAGLDNFNGKIDDFFKEKESKSKKNNYSKSIAELKEETDLLLNDRVRLEKEKDKLWNEFYKKRIKGLISKEEHSKFFERKEVDKLEKEINELYVKSRELEKILSYKEAMKSHDELTEQFKDKKAKFIKQYSKIEQEINVLQKLIDGNNDNITNLKKDIGYLNNGTFVYEDDFDKANFQPYKAYVGSNTWFYFDNKEDLSNYSHEVVPELEQMYKMSNETYIKQDSLNKKKENLFLSVYGHKKPYKSFKYIVDERSEIKSITDRMKPHLDESLSFVRKLIGDGFKNSTEIIDKGKGVWIIQGNVENTDNPTVVLNIKEDMIRASCGDNTLTLSQHSLDATIIHEMGHFIEDSNKNIKKDVIEFLNERIKDKEEVFFGEENKERAVKDGFIDLYMGKIYKSYTGQIHATEIISMGFQTLYTEPMELLKNDPKYFDFMINIIHNKRYRNESNS